jgi:TolB-like protein
MKFNLLISCIIGLAILSGCTGSALELSDKQNAKPQSNVGSTNQLISANYSAAITLIKQSCKYLVPEQPILIATLVNIDSLEKSSTLGRISSENIATQFTKDGYNIVEMKFSSSVYMKRNEGEMVLTREMNSIAHSHNAQAVVVGSYGISSDSIYVNLKLVRPGNENIILASYDYVIARNKEIDSMLSSGQYTR